jgi:hypothetical protein
MSAPSAPEHGRITPDQVADSWLPILHEKSSFNRTKTEDDHLLAGLPLIAEGAVRQQDGSPLSLSDLVTRLLDVGSRATDASPFLVESARRLLALGYLHHPGTPEDDPLLSPRAAQAIDPGCCDSELSLARAVTAVELERSPLLVEIVKRHLDSREDAAPDEWQIPALDWLLPLLQDTTAQCLLVNQLAAADVDQTAAALWRRLVTLYAECKPPAWTPGPVATCCALGLVLNRPGEHLGYQRFHHEVTSWTGWQDEDVWPVRHPGSGLNALRWLLTERLARLLRLPDSKLWKAERLTQLLGGADWRTWWPPLAAFVWPAPRRSTVS